MVRIMRDRNINKIPFHRKNLKNKNYLNSAPQYATFEILLLKCRYKKIINTITSTNYFAEKSLTNNAYLIFSDISDMFFQD